MSWPGCNHRQAEGLRPRRRTRRFSLQAWPWAYSASRSCRYGSRPGLALVLVLVLYGEALAGTDVHSHLRYLDQVAAYEQRWRDFLVPRVMDRQGLSARQLKEPPRFAP